MGNWSQVHWLNSTCGGQIQTCDMYWNIGLPCRWCGRQPPIGAFGVWSITYREAGPESTRKG